MKVIYDRETDSLVITLRDAPIQESDEVRPGVIADFGEDGGVVRFEACAPRASSRIRSRCSSRRPAGNRAGPGSIRAFTPRDAKPRISEVGRARGREYARSGGH
ncbi:MAG: DUF2283 domain-containing protein [Thermomicrobiales bacterium]|nr:DUF2283 domain-containing protein [Thermomicrobiales bacterium]